jgi:hypothetical protein
VRRDVNGGEENGSPPWLPSTAGESTVFWSFNFSFFVIFFSWVGFSLFLRAIFFFDKLKNNFLEMNFLQLQL